MFGRCRDNLVHTSTSLSHDGMLQSNARSPVISPSLWYLGLARIFVKGRKTAPTKWLDHMPRTARDYNVYFAVHRYISGVNTSKRVRWQAILVNLSQLFFWRMWIFDCETNSLSTTRDTTFQSWWQYCCWWPNRLTSTKARSLLLSKPRYTEQLE